MACTGAPLSPQETARGGCVCPHLTSFPLSQVVTEISLLSALGPPLAELTMNVCFEMHKDMGLGGGQRACFSFMETLLKVLLKIASVKRKKKKKRQGKGERQQNKQSKTPEAFLFAKQCAHVHTQKQLI